MCQSRLRWMVKNKTMKMTALAQTKTLYLFIDESGNFDFSQKGSKYFVLTALATFDPLMKREELIRLRYELLADGTNQEYFHATEDTQKVRDQVFEILAKIDSTIEIHSVVAQKNKTHSSLYQEHYQKGDKTITRVTGIGLYEKVCQTLLQYIFKGKKERVDKVVIVLGSLFVGERKKSLLQTLKSFLKVNFLGTPFEIYSHPSCADLNCQLADYCCWAISVRRERGEERPYKIILPRIKSEFAIFRFGTTEYYKYTP